MRISVEFVEYYLIFKRTLIMVVRDKKLLFLQRLLPAQLAYFFIVQFVKVCFLLLGLIKIQYLVFSYKI